MDGSIEMEIVRLVREISEDEKRIVLEQKQADAYSMERLKRDHLLEVDRRKESIQRKMNLLTLLKK